MTQNKQITVLLPINAPMAFTYAAPEDVEIQEGDLVSVPFGKKTEIGVVWGTPTENLPESKVKTIYKKIGTANLSDNFRKFIDWVSSYTMSSPGNVLKMTLSAPSALEEKSQILYYKTIPHPNPLLKGEGIHGVNLHPEKKAVKLPLLEGEGRGEVKNFFVTDYTPKLKEYARELRKNSTDEEMDLWHTLRNRRFFGFKFRRQVPFGKYIADFVCVEENLVIELDGGQHAQRQEYDKDRTEFLEKKGFRILRFWNNEFNDNTEGVLLSILSSLAKQPITDTPPQPNPLPQGEGIKLAQISLSENQTEIVSILKEKITANIFSASLLDGVTGSGKTEVYLSAIEEIFKDDTAQVLIMLPEIALTSQVTNRFERRFGFTPLTWHSGMTKSQKEKTWRKVAGGATRMIIGARSALFLPFKNLKLIIVDEEHDGSYKQEEGVVYNARDMAVLRAKIENLPIILASATPSIETMENVKSGKYEWLQLHLRHGGAKMPGVSIIDMRAQKLDAKHFISAPLVNAIRENIKAGRQSLLFLNRRGYAPLVLCRTCGYRFKCEECSTWLVSHKHGNYLMCHHCGFRKPQPKACPECSNEDSLAACGPGVERIEEEVREYFPEANVALMASDSLTHKKMAELLEDILSGKVDIIIGTQVIAKGHHFPNLTLVGVVDGDLGLEGGDLRAAERTYQLLHQVAGRAGREGTNGSVILQSYMPDNNVMQALRKWDRDGFIDAEMLSRQQNGMPPFTRFAALIISGSDENAVSGIARQIANSAPKHNDIKVLGPVPAPIFMLRGKFRYRILIKSARNINIQKWLTQSLSCVKVPASVKVKVDIDPYSFL